MLDLLQNPSGLQLQNNRIALQVKIVVTPLFKSSAMQQWLILGKFLFEKQPFTIEVFCGDSKPQDAKHYLKDFVEDMAHLEQGFTVYGKLFHLRVKCFICDATARSFMNQGAWRVKLL